MTMACFKIMVSVAMVPEMFQKTTLEYLSNFSLTNLRLGYIYFFFSIYIVMHANIFIFFVCHIMMIRIICHDIIFPDVNKKTNNSFNIRFREV